MIKLYKYFFEDEVIDNYNPEKVVQGETRRSLNGKAHTTTLGSNAEYMRFNLELTGLTSRQLEYIMEIIDKMIKPGSENAIEFVNQEGESYDVIIPLPLEDNADISGELDNYSVTLVLEEEG